MITLVPLCTMTMTVDRALNAGPAPTGQRMVAGISGATVSGRLAGEMVGGGNADWFTMTANGLMLPDVRLVIQTHDEAIVLSVYPLVLRVTCCETGCPVRAKFAKSRIRSHVIGRGPDSSCEFLPRFGCLAARNVVYAGAARRGARPGR